MQKYTQEIHKDTPAAMARLLEARLLEARLLLVECKFALIRENIRPDLVAQIDAIKDGFTALRWGDTRAASGKVTDVIVRQWQSLDLPHDALENHARRMERERDAWRAKHWNAHHHAHQMFLETVRLRTGIEECLRQNGHLADGDDCTLAGLKRLLSPNGRDEPRAGSAVTPKQ